MVTMEKKKNIREFIIDVVTKPRRVNDGKSNAHSVFLQVCEEKTRE